MKWFLGWGLVKQGNQKLNEWSASSSDKFVYKGSANSGPQAMPPVYVNKVVLDRSPARSVR